MKQVKWLLTVLFAVYLGLHNGYIALWQTGSEMPQQVFPYRAELFPKVDQDLLTEGIAIRSERDLSKLLEDYLS